MRSKLLAISRSMNCKMKITKRQLRRIIKEETRKLQEMDPASAGMAAAGGMSPADRGMVAAMQDDRMRDMGIDPDMGLFDVNYLYDLFYDEFAEVNPSSTRVPAEAFDMFEDALAKAIQKLKRDLS